MKILLAADVGGTKVNLRAFELETDNVLAEGYYLCADYTSLTVLVKAFLVQLKGAEIEAACFGLPAPIQGEGRKVPLTNLHWVVDADEIEAACHIKKLILINDFSAAAYGLEVLQPEDCITLQKNTYPPIKQSQGNRLLIGAGTGLGVSLVSQCHGHYTPHPSEGGHIDFAPLNEEQEHLLRWLHQKWQHASYERLLSGEGIKTLYRFLSTQTQGSGKRHTPTAPEISLMAHQGDPLAMRTLQNFVEIYGAFVGNMALIWPATAGIYIVGGIASKIQDWMIQDNFLSYAHQKGRMSSMIEKMGIHLVVNEKLGVLGATDYLRQKMLSS